MTNDLIVERRDPIRMQQCYKEAKRIKPKANERELLAMAKAIYTEMKQ